MTRLPEPFTLTSRSSSGSVLSYGAHTLSWAPEGGEPVLWVSARAHWETGRAIRGGVPICFPWFGPGRSGDMEPAHGFARTTQWELTDHGQDPQGAAFAEYGLIPERVADDLRAAFPHEFAARFRVSAGETLRMELTVENTGEETFDFEEALHTYLHVGDSRQISLRGLDGLSYHDKVTGEDRIHAGDLTISRETDAVFAHRGEVLVVDPVLDRVLALTKEGSDSTVVWNPWTEKSRSMRDFADDEWKAMVCVEAGNVMGSPVRLAGGESHTLAQTVEVRDLTQGAAG